MYATTNINANNNGGNNDSNNDPTRWNSVLQWLGIDQRFKKMQSMMGSGTSTTSGHHGNNINTTSASSSSEQRDPSAIETTTSVTKTTNVQAQSSPTTTTTTKAASTPTYFPPSSLRDRFNFNETWSKVEGLVDSLSSLRQTQTVGDRAREVYQNLQDLVVVGQSAHGHIKVQVNGHQEPVRVMVDPLYLERLIQEATTKTATTATATTATTATTMMMDNSTITPTPTTRTTNTTTSSRTTIHFQSVSETLNTAILMALQDAYTKSETQLVEDKMKSFWTTLGLSPITLSSSSSSSTTESSSS